MRPTLVAFVVLWSVLAPANSSQDLEPLLKQVSIAYAKLEPQSIRPAEGYMKYDYLIPGGYYKQMWDWDGFFIGSHLAHQSREQAKYLKGWVLYHAETGEGLAPTPEQSKDHIFTGFVGWNLLVQDMLQCEAHKDCLLLNWPGN
jgi:hypothetical protein